MSKAQIPPHFIRRRNGPLASASERQVLGAVFRQPGLTQAQITHMTGLAQQSTSRLINGLCAYGALRTGERLSRGRRGQPSAALSLEPDFACAFGVAIMTDAVGVALIDFCGSVIDQTVVPMGAMTHSNVAHELNSILRRMRRKWVSDPSRLFGVGVGIAGYFLNDKGLVNTPMMLDDWALVDIREMLAEDLDLPVWIENDAKAAAIGESMLGVGRWTGNFVYLYVATGLGGGVVIDGDIVRGRHGNAGEIGEMLPPHVYPHPNLEFLRMLVSQHGKPVHGISELIRDFDISWPGVDEWIMRTRDSFSLISSAAAAMLDCEAIVIGGRIPPVLAEKIVPHIEIYSQHRRGSPRPLPKIVPAEVRGEVTAIGAAAMTFKTFFFG